MPRRYRYRRYRSRKSHKYSIETGIIPIPTGTASVTYGSSPAVTANANAGIRKVKNVQIQFSSSAVETNRALLIAWALVYVPYNTTLNEIPSFGQTPTYLYEPSQFVVMSGMYDTENPGNTARQFTPLSRNLQPGDSIQLIWRSNIPIASGIVRCLLRYAITFD